jgi:hypothetical protein
MGETARQPACGQRCVQLSPQRQPRERGSHPGHRPCGCAAIAGGARGRIRWRAGAASASARADTRPVVSAALRPRAMQVSSLISVLRAPRRMRQTQRSVWSVNGSPSALRRTDSASCPGVAAPGSVSRARRGSPLGAVGRCGIPDRGSFSADHRNPQDINDSHPSARLVGTFSASKTAYPTN